jgi:hypothetical protein
MTTYDEQPANVRGIAGTFKRIFRVSNGYADKAAFNWVVIDNLPQYKPRFEKTIFDWVMMRTSIVVDLTGHFGEESKLTEYTEVGSQVDILTKCGIISPNVIRHRVFMSRHHECFGLLPQKYIERKLSSECFDTADELKKDDIVLSSLESKTVMLARKVDVAECKNEICQMCTNPLYDRFYVVRHLRNAAFGFCKFCARSQRFAKLTKDCTVFCATHTRTLDDVSNDVFAIPSNIVRHANALLIELINNNYIQNVRYKENTMLVYPRHMYCNDMLRIDEFLTSVKPSDRYIILIRD